MIAEWITDEVRQTPMWRAVQRFNRARRNRFRIRHEGFVYFMSVGYPDKWVKIGYTAGNPWARMKALQTGSPEPLFLLGFIIGDQDTERELHDVLAEYRTQGEWFECTPRVQRVIADALGVEVFAA